MRSVTWMIGGAAIGLALGVMGGEAVGRLIRSDNLPFFWALGGFVGVCVGLAVALIVKWIRRDGRSPSAKAAPEGLHDTEK
jgi:hypothetical protein